MIKCPVCNGTKLVVSEKSHPQNTKESKPCHFCHMTGEVEEIPTRKSILKIYKYHGTYAELSNIAPE